MVAFDNESDPSLWSGEDLVIAGLDDVRLHHRPTTQQRDSS
jgi:hypothetical protein